MKKLMLLALSAFIFCVAKSQDIVYLSFFEIINIHSDYQYSTTKLFQNYMENQGKYHVVIPDRQNPDSIIITSKSVIKQNASALGAKYYIEGEINRLGELVIINIVMFETASGAKIWSGIQKTKSPEDLDPILDKFAYHISHQIPFSSNNDIYNITEYETNNLNKVASNNYFGIEIIGGTSFISGIDKNIPAGFGFVYSSDVRNYILDLKAEFLFSDINLYGFNMNLSYPISKKRQSPFIGAGLGFGGTTLNVKNEYNEDEKIYGSGLTLFLGGGYLFDRTSVINIKLNSSAFLSLYKVGDKLPIGVLFSMIAVF